MIILSIGSNLPSSFGDRFDNINLAISHLKKYGINLVKRSSFYESPSYPDETKPKFINIVINVKNIIKTQSLFQIIDEKKSADIIVELEDRMRESLLADLTSKEIA